MNRVLVLYFLSFLLYTEYNKKITHTYKSILQAKSLNLISKMCLWSIDDDVEKWIVYIIDDDCHLI